MASRGALSRWTFGVLAAVMTACLSPTLPMPPPSRPDIEGPDERGVVVLSGYAPPESWIYADNQTTGDSAGQRAKAETGAYRLSLMASIGDRISMFYRLDTEESMALSFVIPTLSAYPRGTGGQAGSTGAAGTSGLSGTAGRESVAGAAAGVGGQAGSP